MISAQPPKIYNYHSAAALHEEAILGCLRAGPRSSKVVARFLHRPFPEILARMHQMRDAGELRINDDGLWEKTQ